MNLNLARYIDRWIGLAICLVLYVVERVAGRFTGRRIPPILATTPPQEGVPPHHPRRVLCMKFYGLGNIVMLLPVLAALRQRHPDVEIDFMTMVGGNVALLEQSGLVTHAIGVETDGLFRFLGSFRATMRHARARRYDSVLDFEQFVKISTIIGFLAGSRERIGFNTDGQWRGFMYTRRVVYTDSDHMSVIFARLLKPLGIESPLPTYTLPLDATDRTTARTFLTEHGVAPDHFPVIGMHLGTGANFYRVPVKRWDPTHFGTLADALAADHGARVVFTGQGAEERDLLAQARAGMRHPPIDAADRFGVTTLAALLAECDLVVANDTSVMHLAALVGTPVVGIFGPTAPLHYGPRGEHNLVIYRDLYCSPCLTNYNLKVSRCVDPVCMRGISPAAVLEAIVGRYLRVPSPDGVWVRQRGLRATLE